LYNIYGFFALYANIDKFRVDRSNLIPVAERTELDRWIISKLQSLVKEVTGYYEDYEPTRAARAVETFVDAHLSNWYVRLSRRRFWKGDMSRDKQAAYETLYECLYVVAQLMSPVSPFFSDWLYRNLTDGHDSESVHLTHLTLADDTLIDRDLEERMELAQRFTSLILSLRKKVFDQGASAIGQSACTCSGYQDEGSAGKGGKLHTQRGQCQRNTICDRYSRDREEEGKT
jgi:isoleucyl-tRNA synthetase